MYIGPNCCIVEDVVIGDDVTIGAEVLLLKIYLIIQRVQVITQKY